MLIEKIEDNLNKIVENLNKDTFIYDLLIAYQQPKAAISRLKKGDYNLSNINNEVIWKKKLLFHRVTDQDPHIKIDELAKDEKVIKHEPRFLVVTDFKIFLAISDQNHLSCGPFALIPGSHKKKFRNYLMCQFNSKILRKTGSAATDGVFYRKKHLQPLLLLPGEIAFCD